MLALILASSIAATTTPSLPSIDSGVQVSEVNCRTHDSVHLIPRNSEEYVQVASFLGKGAGAEGPEGAAARFVATTSPAVIVARFSWTGCDEGIETAKGLGDDQGTMTWDDPPDVGDIVDFPGGGLPNGSIGTFIWCGSAGTVQYKVTIRKVNGKWVVTKSTQELEVNCSPTE